MYPHRIRLRGPWECESLTGKVRHKRHFGRPGRLDEHERVWLTISGSDATAEVWLNGQHLGWSVEETKYFECDVTGRLLHGNDLTVETAAANGNAGARGEVSLEIRCTAFLRAVRISGTREGDIARIHAAGEVVGTCEGPLELYLLLDRATLNYAKVETDPNGRPFSLTSEPISLGKEDWSEPHQARVELVNVATVWYETEASIHL